MRCREQASGATEGACSMRGHSREAQHGLQGTGPRRALPLCLAAPSVRESTMVGPAAAQRGKQHAGGRAAQREAQPPALTSLQVSCSNSRPTRGASAAKAPPSSPHFAMQVSLKLQKRLAASVLGCGLR